MAKKNNSRSAMGGGVIVLSLLLLAAIICGAITHGFTTWTTCGCFGHKYGDDGVCVRCKEAKPTEKTDGAVVDNDGNVMDSDKVYAMPTGMTFSSARQLNAEPSEETEKSVTITATIEPADATNKNVDWSVAFVNADSTWASGKIVTNYVTVTPTSDGSLTATVTCKQAFGEQIVVQCVAQDNAEASASCTVDYRKRVENVAVSIDGFMSGGFISGSISLYTDNAPTKNVSRHVTYSVGTVGGDEEVIIEYKLGDIIYSQMSAHFCMGHDWNTCKDVNHLYYQLNQDWHQIGNTLTTDISFLEPMFKFVPTNYTSALNSARIIFKNTVGAIVFRITCGDWTKELSFQTTVENFKISVTNVTLNQGTLEF